MQYISSSHCYNLSMHMVYTAENATDLMQVVDFNGLMQVMPTSGVKSVTSDLMKLDFADLLQVDEKLTSSLHADCNLQQVC